jgi:hypothetical protein
MKYIILILVYVINLNGYSQQIKRPKKKPVKIHKVNTDSIIRQAALIAVDSLKAKGYIKN